MVRPKGKKSSELCANLEERSASILPQKLMGRETESKRRCLACLPHELEKDCSTVNQLTSHQRPAGISVHLFAPNLFLNPPKFSPTFRAFPEQQGGESRLSPPVLRSQVCQPNTLGGRGGPRGIEDRDAVPVPDTHPGYFRVDIGTRPDKRCFFLSPLVDGVAFGGEKARRCLKRAPKPPDRPLSHLDQRRFLALLSSKKRAAAWPGMGPGVVRLQKL